MRCCGHRFAAWRHLIGIPLFVLQATLCVYAMVDLRTSARAGLATPFSGIAESVAPAWVVAAATRWSTIGAATAVWAVVAGLTADFNASRRAAVRSFLTGALMYYMPLPFPYADAFLSVYAVFTAHGAAFWLSAAIGLHGR